MPAGDIALIVFLAAAFWTGYTLKSWKTGLGASLLFSLALLLFALQTLLTQTAPGGMETLLTHALLFLASMASASFALYLGGRQLGLALSAISDQTKSA